MKLNNSFSDYRKLEKYFLANKEEFIESLKKSLDDKISHLNSFFGCDVDKYFSGCGTQDAAARGAFLGKAMEVSIKKALSDCCMNRLEMVDANGYDIMFDEKIPLEVKSSGSSLPGFTGNKYSTKVDNYMFIKYTIKNGKIDGLFISMVHMPLMSNGFTSNENAGFSSYKIKSEDIRKVSLLYGNLKANRIYAKELVI
jgi:hypothetical protein